MKTCVWWCSIGILLVVGAGVAAAQQGNPEVPPPQHANVRYGPHERNVLDLWLAETDGPAPLVIYYHGGGFRGGDKRTIPAGLLKMLLESGIHVAAANYRLSDTAPYPAQMLDSARALQGPWHWALVRAANCRPPGVSPH